MVGAGDPHATYRAGRATLCAGPDDLIRYGHVFEAWFGVREHLPRTVARERPREISPPLPMGDSGETGGIADPEVIHAAASDVEVLRHRDVAQLTPDEKALLDAMIRGLQPRLPLRRAVAVRRGAVARSTCTGPCAPRSARWASPDGSSTGVAGPPLVGWCCSWTSRHRCGPTPTPSCGWPTSSRRARRRQGRGVHAGHEAHPDHAPAAHRRCRTGSGPRGRAGPRLVRRHPPRRDLEGVSGPWAPAGWLAAPSLLSSATAGERGDASELGEQMQRSRLALALWVNPHRARGYEPVQQASGQPCRTVTTSWRVTR